MSSEDAILLELESLAGGLVEAAVDVANRGDVAEAAGIGATGIGCFFDDAVHRVFGFSDLEFQSLYHFTIGGPVEDSRLTTLAPYGVREEDELKRCADRG